MKKWNIGNLWKKYKYVGLVVLAGILLMLLPGKKFWAFLKKIARRGKISFFSQKNGVQY